MAVGVKRKKGNRVILSLQYESQTAFLEAFERYGTIGKACEAAGCSRTRVYDWRRGDVQGFAGRWELSRHRWRETLEDRMISRLEDPQGNRGSDILLMFALKGAYPEKYKDTVVVTDNSAKDLIARLRASPVVEKGVEGREVEGEFKALPGAVGNGVKEGE